MEPKDETRNRDPKLHKPMETNMTLFSNPIFNRKYIFLDGGFSIVMLYMFIGG